MKNSLVSIVLRSLVPYVAWVAFLIWVYVMARSGYGTYVIEVLDAFGRMISLTSER
jgi:hypothetical protein